MNNNLLITIFVPVYNGEKYLLQTLTSIKQQTYTNIEVLLVDDSSTDESLQIINKYAQEDKRFKVFVKENGGMVASSLNFIMPKIRGDYFFYSSQDDIFSLDLIEKMVQKQNETAADCIVPNMEFYFENKPNNRKVIGLNGNLTIELTGKEACVSSLNWTISGFMLIKSSLLKAEFFPEDAFDSDEFVTRKLFLKSNKVVFSEGVFYYRQDNVKAITKTFTKKNFFVLNSSWKLYNLLKENDFEEKVVFNCQLGIIQQYLDIFSLYEAYRFESELDKKEVELFLLNFKKNYLTDSFIYSKFKYLIQKLECKYMVLIAVLKNPFLFRLFMKYKDVKLKRSKFLLNSYK